LGERARLGRNSTRPRVEYLPAFLRDSEDQQPVVRRRPSALQQIAQSFACNLMSAAVDQCHVASIRAMNHTRP